VSAPLRAIVIGSSDGIGLALTRALLERRWEVSGLSRSASPVSHAAHRHTIADVREERFGQLLTGELERGRCRLVVYCAGIGEPFDTAGLREDVATFETNLVGLARTAACALPHLAAHAPATFVGLSSLGDVLRSAASPAYGASKAGVSHYLESLARAFKPSRVHIVNVRLGFVDTKMSKAPYKPFLLSPEQAAGRILRGVLVSAPRRRLNIPRRAAVAVRIASLLMP